jgi:HK97 family phage prohead protease
MRRAYSILELKEFDDESREFSGLATTPTVDRMGDVVESKGAEFKLPIPFLSHHSPEAPIGLVTSAKVTKDGIQVKGHVLRLGDDEPASLRERVNVAWAEIKHGLVRGLSIGFQPLESEPIKDSYGVRFTKWSWLELSAVTIPANAEASILTIRSIDRANAASFGTKRQPVQLIPGVSGKKTAKRGGIPIIPR